MIEHKINQLDNFICGYYTDKKVCDELILYFENSNNKIDGKLYGGDGQRAVPIQNGKELRACSRCNWTGAGGAGAGGDTATSQSQSFTNISCATCSLKVTERVQRFNQKGSFTFCPKTRNDLVKVFESVATDQTRR